MASSASIAQEFYKVREYWAEIDPDKKWRLAVWVAQFQDVEIIDKFMETERLSIGVFDDIFFRFDIEYRGDDKVFEKALYEEWVSWFTEKPDPKRDILQALKNDGLLLRDYFPDTSLKPSIENLWKEMLRFKACIDGLEDFRFCVYMAPSRPDGDKLTDWFSQVLDKGVPEGIRLTTVDFAEKRKVKLKASSEVKIIEPELNMLEAIGNDMDKGIVSDNPVSPENRFTLQIKKVMDCTLQKSTPALDKEVKSMLSLAEELNTVSTSITALMIAGQAYFSVNNWEKCEHYADKAIADSEKAMEAGEPSGYHIWKAAVMQKAAVLANKKKRREAIGLYEKLAEKASKNADAYYVMEAYRMAGHFYYEYGELTVALETLLLSLYGGSYLEKEVRRQSTFLFSASLAYYLADKVWDEGRIKMLHEVLEEWLGSDWKELIEDEDMKKVKDRRKSSLFS